MEWVRVLGKRNSFSVTVPRWGTRDTCRYRRLMASHNLAIYSNKRLLKDTDIQVVIDDEILFRSSSKNG